MSRPTSEQQPLTTPRPVLRDDLVALVELVIAVGETVWRCEHCGALNRSSRMWCRACCATNHRSLPR
jgi:hypothetical protein